ncbi:hypothetical protein BDP27DRAFT_1256815 [Rhodocollybia butyracea]|uniref:Mitochondrial protein n=1 Tax=Rhodocollybia butyracea TaxID=206335 RepID=A0A9P5Q773_9AGAR|nr:hypothetical protein BDP27DRAFT_1256815 [Rhodocollybia butyracea]
MIIRQLSRWSRNLHTDIRLPSSTTSLIPVTLIPVTRRDAHTTPINLADPRSPHSVSLAHPMDPSSSSSQNYANSNKAPDEQELSSSPSSPPPPATTPSIPESEAQSSSPNLPSTVSHYRHKHAYTPVYNHPPFHTHTFLVALERTFPTEIAEVLMRATYALLIDRIGRVRREGLTYKDLDNQAYLFRAALSELRSEISLTTKNDSAAVQAATTALRREVDRLDVKMKEDITTLKHEVQIELDNRKNEVKDEFTSKDIAIEELLSKSIVSISDLRTDVEEVKWDNMRRAVVGLFAFASVIIIGMEVRPKSPPSPPPVTPVALTPIIQATSLTPAGNDLEWVT